MRASARERSRDPTPPPPYALPVAGSDLPPLRFASSEIGFYPHFPLYQCLLLFTAVSCEYNADMQVATYVDVRLRLRNQTTQASGELGLIINDRDNAVAVYVMQRIPY